MEQKKFSTRKFEISDVDGIVELFNKVFQGNFSREWWERKYLQNPAGFHGEKGDVWIAETSDGKVVGHWAVIPERLKLGSKTVEVAQAVDAATHPDYQGQGIFKSLVKNVCSDAKERYGLVFGYPNEIYKGYEKLGWRSYRITEFLNFVNYDRALGNYFKNRVFSGLAKTALKALRAWNFLGISLHSDKITGDKAEIEEVSEFSGEMENFWNLSRSQYEIALERDYHFLLWRFSEQLGSYRRFIAHSSSNGKILGYAVFKKTSIRAIPEVLDVVDLHSLPDQDKTIVDLIKSAVEIGKKEEFNVIHCRVPSWHKYGIFLRKLMFVQVGNALELAGLYQPRLITYPPTQEEMIDIKGWFYTLADTDYA
jgi:GNAT superfamily N-acetyltransferase